MSFWTDLRVPAQHEALIAFFDCNWLRQYAEKTSDKLEVMAAVAGYFTLTGGIIAEAGGRLIKTMGDGGLAVFPADLIDEGVLAFHQVQEQGEAWFARRGEPVHVTVRMDVGPVVFGMVGSPDAEILDVLGKAVALAHLLPSTGFSVSPTVFRHLRPETRKLFKKHTPPVRYIAADDHHPRERAPE